MENLTAYPSHANFILVRTESGQAEPLFNFLLENGVLVKKLHGSHPLLGDCLRFTIGKPEENQKLLQAVQDFLAHA
ncbi:MAG TPA: hypothetical protein ENG92_01120 [Thiolapillus brandeum]|uniref:histidinol-phosphate transaminase n=1 Tax=Thiolapillus brandeum TaxID=1076588 RepID=A0A831JWH0_9GAMM|nr:hypothetical protein [Thiolapillus brandeum]